MIEVLVFDFDGVIIDSNKLKYDAFFQIFSSIPGSATTVKKILNEHRERTRFFIIKEILLNLERQEKFVYSDMEDLITAYANKYNEIAEEGAKGCNETLGARTILEQLSKQYALYINSTTPLDSLIRIVDKRSLKNLFKGIYGGPKTKLENLSNILRVENISPNEVVIIGDGKSDIEVATKFGCHFIGLRNEFNKFNNINFPLIEELSLLPEIINNLWAKDE